MLLHRLGEQLTEGSALGSDLSMFIEARRKARTRSGQNARDGKTHYKDALQTFLAEHMIPLLCLKLNLRGSRRL